MEKQLEPTGRTPDILKEELALQRFVGAGLSQAVVEGEVALPGGLREETRVLSSEALAVLEHSSADSGRVSADGRVTFHVLYTQGDPTKISAVEASADFTHTTDIPGSAPGMTAPVSLMVEHVEANAAGGRLHLTAIVRVYTRVFTDEPVPVVTGVRGVDGLMTRTETLSAVRTASMGAQDVLIRDECDLGAVLQISDTLCATASASVQDVMGGEERVTLSGQVLVEAVHVSAMPSRPLVITRHAIPFEETIALTGSGGDQLCCWAVVKDVAVLSQETQEDGERTLRAEVLLGLRAETTAVKEVTLLLDAYTTAGDELSLEHESVQRVTGMRRLHTAESGKLTLVMENQPPARTPLKASLRPVITDLNRQGGKLLAEGMMDVNLLYMTDDTDVVQTFHTEEPFRMVFACDPSLPESIVLTPANVEVIGITSDRVEVKYILNLDCLDAQLQQSPLVTQVSAKPSEPEEPGILLCVSHPGETLWQIARRYRVSPESLQRMNPALQDGAKEPQRVILWKRS